MKPKACCSQLCQVVSNYSKPESDRSYEFIFRVNLFFPSTIFGLMVLRFFFAVKKMVEFIRLRSDTLVMLKFQRDSHVGGGN